MNHFCVRFVKLTSDDKSASYRVESFEFNEYDAWEEIARLHIRVPERGYAFEPLSRWECERILSPTFYLLAPDEQDRQFREVFGPLRMGLGAYALRVHEFALRCIEREDFPQRHPHEYFPSNSACEAAAMCEPSFLSLPAQPQPLRVRG